MAASMQVIAKAQVMTPQHAAPQHAARDRPWAVLPPGFAALIRAENVRLVPEIVREIRRQIPEYARPLDGSFGAGIQQGAARALAQFAELVADDSASPEESLQVYRALGRGEWREGRSLDALQAAYRLGARLAWRRYAQVARRVGMPPTAMAVLAEAIFAHIDEMAAASVEGYAEARADAVGTLRRSRQRMVTLLASGAGEPVLVEAARAARWELPERIAGVALLPGGSAGSVAAGLRTLPSALAELDGPEPCLFLADPDTDGRMEQLGRALADRTAVIGPAVPGPQAAQSLRWARTVAVRMPQDAAPGLVHCDRQLSSVLLLGDEELVRLLGDRRLAPLDGLTAKRRRRLEATLLVWLDTSRGSAPEVAARLGLHPQTVRQRMRRIEALFGEALADPDARFEIEVALRGRLLHAGMGRGEQDGE
ncbi:hypothetical protein ABIA33_000176 [Streptacidiphilus sp. MAP12-16]|uniref:PucR family transcriptional regulator n=1 Tax=Streptacidiphilus sp. MAP12-16 TaxID=3156300 RepID=UPI0035145024